MILRLSPLMCTLKMAVTVATSQVSNTKSATSARSNMHQKSLVVFLIRLKARNLVRISRTKSMQSKCAATWKTGEDCERVMLSLLSMSTAVHTELATTRNNEAASNLLLRATYW